ncbi:copine-5-like [Symsagittifera roscoffensis]|uniref:copine-5-like n=1 Tax=Symsagittifera roscoffensis TaxID=84072 RepID=UPI00307C3450
MTAASDSELSNLLDLTVSCKDLKNKDTFSKSDPMCVVMMRESSSSPYVEVGRTERVENNLNPSFTTPFRMKYFFERSQQLRFEVYDCDSSSGSLDHHDKLGHLEVSLAEVVQGRLATQGKLLVDSGNTHAKIFIRAQQTVECRESWNICFSARGLDNKDFFGLSDPYLVFYKKSAKGDFIVTGQTKVIKNNLNPNWEPFIINKARFNDNDEQLPIKIECYDYNSDGSPDFIGDVTTTGGELFKEIGSKSFPVRSFIVTGQTKVIKNNLNPNWEPFIINKARFNDNDDQLPIKIECYDYNSDGSPDFIGDVTTTGGELFKEIGSKSFPLINQHKKEKKGKKYKNSGVLLVSSLTSEEECDFIYYVQAGLQISFIVAVDFTASNGNPQVPNSLHYFNPQYAVNQYTTAIQAVGNVIQEYDSDKLFPVYGFGGRFFGTQVVSHNYPLNNNPDNPNVVGVQGILDSYRYAISHSQLAGPTYFQPIIKAAMRTASQFQTGLHYFMLLIITDGAIVDLDATIEAVIEASHYPLSIIIIGVGDADFDSMEALDSDKAMLSSGNRVAARDIVQFVALRDIIRPDMDPSRLSVQHQQQLAMHVLAEVPRQVKDYLKPKGVYPSTVQKLAQQDQARLNPNSQTQ